MPPQAIFATTCHVTPPGTAPDRRNTVLGLGQGGLAGSGPDRLGKPVSSDAGGCSRDVDAPRRRISRPVTGNGARHTARCRESGAVRAYEAIERAVPAGAAAGGRYDERQMAMLDSERSRAT
jgi:hypothetical protein